MTQNDAITLLNAITKLNNLIQSGAKPYCALRNVAKKFDVDGSVYALKNGQWIRRITTLSDEGLNQPIQSPQVLTGLWKNGIFCGVSESPGVFRGQSIFVQTNLHNGKSIVLSVGINEIDAMNCLD